MQNSQVEIAAVENTSRRGRGRGRRQHHHIEGEPAQNACPRGRGRKHHHYVARDPAQVLARLLKKQQKAADALNSLDSDIDEKRRQRFIEKKAKIDEQIQELMNVTQEEPEKKPQKEAPQLTTELTPQAPKEEVVAKAEEKVVDEKPASEVVETVEEKTLALEDSRSHYKLALREASQRYLSLRKELKDEHHRIKKLREVVKALKILSKAGIAAECRVTVGPQQSEMAEEDLALAKQRIGKKKLLAREQARAVRELIRSHKKEHKKSGHKRPRRERKEEEGEERKRVHHRRRHEKKVAKDDLNEERRKHHKKGRKQHKKAKKIRYERKTRQTKRCRKHAL